MLDIYKTDNNAYSTVTQKDAEQNENMRKEGFQLCDAIKKECVELCGDVVSAADILTAATW